MAPASRQQLRLTHRSLRASGPTYASGDIAAKLRRAPSWFYEHKRELLARGMPAPLDLPGHPRWSAAQIDAWLAGVDLRRISGRPPLEAANDPAPIAAPEAEAWDPYLRAVYAAR